MRPMNHTRQLLKSLKKFPHINKHLGAEALSYVKEVLATAEKFMLPDDGEVIDPQTAAAVLDDASEINLPYPEVVIEFRGTDANWSPLKAAEEGKVLAPKRLALAWDGDQGSIPEPGKIVVLSAWQDEGIARALSKACWVLGCFVCIKKSDIAAWQGGGTWPYLEAWVLEEWEANRYSIKDKNDFHKRAMSDSLDEIAAVFNLIAALSCTNVTAPVTHTPRKSSIKTAYPFHSYRELVLGNRLAPVGTGQGGGSSRSPREHLRRGHIRRLANGNRTWINATVVNAGVGGCVDKTYRMNNQQLAGGAAK